MGGTSRSRRSPGLLGWWGWPPSSSLSVGQEGASTWVFLAVTGLWTFRLRLGLVLGVLLAVLYEFLTFHVDGWSHDASITMSIILAMAAVTGGMAASQRQRALAEARQENARLAIQEERNRMARDVHDILGHSLTVITVKAELAARLLEVDPDRARAEVADLERLGRDALADVRRAVVGFREMSLPAELARRASPWRPPASRRTCRPRRTRSRRTCARSAPGRCARGSPTSSGTAAR